MNNVTKENQSDYYKRLVKELKVYMDFMGGQTPKIQGHLGLQIALNTLCSRIRTNQKIGRKRAELRQHLERVAVEST